MIIVLDANAGIEVALNRPQAARLKIHIANATKTITSDLYKAEVTNTLWKYVQQGYISKDKALHLLNLSQDIIDEYIGIEENNDEALSESVRLKHSVYDMLYFTLARRTSAMLMTLDKKLLARAQQEGIETYD